MPLTVLIVEDEQSAARLLSGIAAEVGVSTRTTGSAREARELCARAAAQQAPFAAVVLDLVLSEQDGFQFATAARAAPWGEKLPLIVISGVYKQLPGDFSARVHPAAFFAKPFEPSALRAALLAATGQESPAAAIEGHLRDKPPAALFIELLRSKATGVLTLTHEAEKRVVTFQQGLVRFAQSNIKAETVGAAQVASGLIKQTSFDRAVALARQQGIALHEALATARVMTPEQLKVALKQQTADVCAGALALAAGGYRFEQKSPQALSATPDLRTSPVALLLDAVKRQGDVARARAWLGQRRELRMGRSPDLERELFSLKSFWPGEGVTPLANSGRAIGEVLARVREAELPLLHALCESGLIQLSGARTAQASAAPAARSAADDDGKVFNAREHAARTMLLGENDHLKDASHYEVLGVQPGADVEQIKNAYFAAAKRFHSDSFSGMDLGAVRAVAEELFSRVNEAYSVLLDKDKRAEYDVYLDRKAKGLPTDVGAILRAEGVFQKGEALFRIGRYEDAEAQFREAVALNQSEAEFHAYLGMSIFKRGGKPEEALQHVEQALTLDPRLRSGTVFAAQLLEELGELERAKTLLRKAIDKDPDFAHAKDELRRLKQRPAVETKGGFLSRLLKK